MRDRYDVVIVGGGHAGAQAALSLTQLGHDGTIAIVGDENELPYERPPLSKDYLAGERPFERLAIRPAAIWQERGVEFLLGSRVVSVDADARNVETAAGRTIGYNHLIWAAGGDARRLTCAGGDLLGVHSVRNRTDVDRMIAEMPNVDRAVVIGGGYIGLEAAAVLTKLGKTVVLLEALPRVLARVAGEPLSRFFEAEHRAHGVDLRVGVQVDCVTGRDGRATGVRLSDGSVVPAEMVIVGIGIVPSVAPLIEAGAAGSNGVRVDRHCRTSFPNVYAIGDCAEHANDFADGAFIRLESVQNANDQATIAAKAIRGIDEPYSATPWFWSNQYDLRLQTVGLSGGHDALVLRGDPATRSFSVVYLRAARVIALDCVNAVRDYAQGRKLVEQGIVAVPEDIADTGRQLKSFLPG